MSNPAHAGQVIRELIGQLDKLIDQGHVDSDEGRDLIRAARRPLVELNLLSCGFALPLLRCGLCRQRVRVLVDGVGELGVCERCSIESVRSAKDVARVH